ncbi:hypothetical protein E2C01_069572 [Portunus trituberculatus]|uniref:Uncharacterized protein n=1 Tax=Portunus trituberculatus TaxID=210409 RepID=A0A5B7I2P9_PORTR|nr:hypothetical protein [Portunus trituberculatus]
MDSLGPCTAEKNLHQSATWLVACKAMQPTAFRASGIERASHCCVEYLASRERCRLAEQRRRICNTAPAGVNPLRASQYSTECLQDRKAAVDVPTLHFSGADGRPRG